MGAGVQGGVAVIEVGGGGGVGGAVTHPVAITLQLLPLGLPLLGVLLLEAAAGGGAAGGAGAAATWRPAPVSGVPAGMAAAATRRPVRLGCQHYRTWYWRYKPGGGASRQVACIGHNQEGGRTLLGTGFQTADRRRR
jgi:hypothetical protein